MFDPNKTLALIQGGLLEPQKTWASYHEENREWKDTAALLTGPLILASLVLASLLGWVFSSHYMMMRGSGGLLGLILGLLFAAVGIAMASFIFSYFAGMLKGEANFNRSFAALSLAAIPAYLGNVLGTLPWIGWLLSLGLGIVSLVFLYQIIPLYLKVPDEKRVQHYAASLVCTLIASLILGALLGFGAMGSYQAGMMGERSGGSSNVMFGDLGRQARVMEEAERDTFDPPRNGKINETQMERYLDVIQKTAELRREQGEAFKQLEKKSDKDSVSLGDLGKLTGTLMGAATAEMDVVKTGGGNWAEHMWVKEQLHVARIQKDISDAVKHNYALYKQYEERLSQVDQ